MSQQPNIDRKSLIIAIISGVCAVAIWGGWPVVTRFGVQQTLTPYDITALRFGVAGLLLLPLLLRKGLAGLKWSQALILSCGAGAPYVIVSAVGLTFAPAGHLGVIEPSCMLTFSMLGGWLLLGDKIDGPRLGGYAIIIGGVLLVGWEGLSSGAEGAWIGDLLFVAGGLLWATYTVASRAWSVNSFHATALVSVLSMVLYLPGYLIFGNPQILHASLAEIAFQGVAQGVLAGIMALVFYTHAVTVLGAARGAVFGTLVPGFAVLLAFPVLGEVPNGRELLGLMTVTVGMYFALGLFQRAGAKKNKTSPGKVVPVEMRTK